MNSIIDFLNAYGALLAIVYGLFFVVVVFVRAVQALERLPEPSHFSIEPYDDKDVYRPWAVIDGGRR